MVASSQVADTSSRSRKIAILADLLARLDPTEIGICVAFLSGVPRQGRVGVGYSTICGLERRPAAEPSLTVHDVDRAIGEIEAATGSGSAAARKQLLEQLLDRATESEGEFLRRLFTGELRQGALAGLMVDAVAKAAGVPGAIARRALMLSGDLAAMAEIAMTRGEPGLRGIGFELFRPILPMLAATGTSVGEAMAGFERASVEWKLDGIRIQIHRRGEEVRIYTRNLNEITASLPGIVEAVLELPVAQAVLDGEALWMGEDGPAAFQDTMSQIDSDAPPEGIVTFLFDLLHLDGDDLLDTPLRERSAKLAAIAPRAEDPRRPHRRSAGGTADPRRVVGRGPRGRRRQGRRVARTPPAGAASLAQGQAGAYLRPRRARRRVGTRAPPGLAVEPPPRRPRPRHGRVRDGRKMLQGADRRAAGLADAALLERETDRRGIAVFVRPELVVEIALDGVQASTRYPGGVALRFARVKRYRPDKDAGDADTIDDLRALLP